MNQYNLFNNNIISFLYSIKIYKDKNIECLSSSNQIKNQLIISNIPEQQQQRNYYSQHTKMAKRNQLQQQQQHKYHSQHTEMAKCSQSVATPKTSSNIYINYLNENQIIKNIIDISMELQLICIGLNEIIHLILIIIVYY